MNLPYLNNSNFQSRDFLNPTNQSIFNLTTKASYFYKSNQSIKGSKHIKFNLQWFKL
jgi:hypothetical protein